MRHLLLRSLAGSALLLAGVTANAQYQPRLVQRYEDRTHHYSDHNRLFNRIREDLRRAEDSALPFSADRTRIAMARREVMELQANWNDGDRHPETMENAISATLRVVNENRLPGDTRDLLALDVDSLRDFQEYWR